ncbi:MAG: hypothetical protein ACK4M3_01390 [Pyrobaculum sp.]
MKSREVTYLQLLSLLASSNTPRGRKNLSDELKIGEGVVRSLLEGGRDLGHVTVLRGGVKITEIGLSFLREALEMCGIIDFFLIDEANRLLCGKRCVAYVILDKVDDVIKTRDRLVGLGACGALIIEVRESPVLPPFGESLEKYSRSMAELIKSRARQGSTVVVTCGDTFSDALAVIEFKCREVFREK